MSFIYCESVSAVATLFEGDTGDGPNTSLYLTGTDTGLIPNVGLSSFPFYVQYPDHLVALQISDGVQTPEIVYCWANQTPGGSNPLLVYRGQEGTPINTWAAGATVTGVLTAAVLADIIYPSDDYIVVFQVVFQGTPAPAGYHGRLLGRNDGLQTYSESYLLQHVADGGNTGLVYAVPDPGYEFTSWGDDSSSTDNPLQITGVSGNMNITVEFSRVDEDPLEQGVPALVSRVPVDFPSEQTGTLRAGRVFSEERLASLGLIPGVTPFGFVGHKERKSFIKTGGGE